MKTNIIKAIAFSFFVLFTQFTYSDIFMGIPGNCSQYVILMPETSTTGIFVIAECPNGLLCFDLSTNECDYPVNVDCGDRLWYPDTLTSTYGAPDFALGLYWCQLNNSGVYYQVGSPGTAGENALKDAICSCI